MNPLDAADLIDVVIKSIKENPSQFQISIKVIGQQVTSNGGIGMIASAVGGGPGSIAIGNKVSMSGASVEIAQRQGIDAFNQQANALLATLSEISKALRVPQPDKSIIGRMVDSLKNTWVPGVILGVVGNAVSKAVGI